MALPPVSTSDLEAAVEALAAGDESAVDRVFQLAYEDLRQLARVRLRAVNSGATLNTTALVHEAYLRVRRADGGPVWHSATHFFAFASRAMRHILVDHARGKTAVVRGGGRIHVTLDPGLSGDSPTDPVDILELDCALRLLAEKDPRLERVVECRFFTGLTTEETAEVLGVSERTVARDWLTARSYLRHLMST